MTALRVDVKSFPHTRYPDEVQVWIHIAVGSRDPQTHNVLTLRGLECDFLDTMCSEITSAYMYGERPKDVAIAANSVLKQARAHAAAHEM